MKLRLFNYISIACFFISSAALLFIPLLNFDNGFPAYACYFAGIFWFFILSGIVLQIWLFVKTRKMEVRKSLKLQKMIAVGVFLVSAIVLLCELEFLRTNLIALIVNLFVLLTCIESLSVICRMERLL